MPTGLLGKAQLLFCSDSEWCCPSRLSSGMTGIYRGTVWRYNNMVKRWSFPGTGNGGCRKHCVKDVRLSFNSWIPLHCSLFQLSNFLYSKDLHRPFHHQKPQPNRSDCQLSQGLWRDTLLPHASLKHEGWCLHSAVLEPGHSSAHRETKKQQETGGVTDLCQPGTYSAFTKHLSYPTDSHLLPAVLQAHFCVF